MQDTVAVVTGYASGLGYALSRGLLERGWLVVGVARKSNPADLHSQFAESLVRVQGSVDEDQTAEDAFSRAQDLGRTQLVINCAGTGVFGEIGGYNGADVREALTGNLTGLILFSDWAVREMREQGGSIVNVMSTAGKKLRTAEPVYCAAKWGAKAYTRTLRDAMKASKIPIRVFEVYPCGMNTPFWSRATRPVSDGSNFPAAQPIASRILDEVLAHGPAYCQELTFERS